MKTTLTCLLLALAFTVPALADTLKIPADKPVASITFPEGWK
ncbi:MAG: histidine kinase, partial [Verrucomicrobia bacterium]